MTVVRDCFCNPQPYDDVSVAIVNGRVENALGSRDDGARHSIQLTSDQHMDWFTVEGQFQMMRDALTDGQAVFAEFDAASGRPSSFTFRPWFETPTSEGDLTFEVTAFSPR